MADTNNTTGLVNLTSDRLFSNEYVFVSADQAGSSSGWINLENPSQQTCDNIVNVPTCTFHDEAGTSLDLSWFSVAAVNSNENCVRANFPTGDLSGSTCGTSRRAICQATCGKRSFAFSISFKLENLQMQLFSVESYQIPDS